MCKRPKYIFGARFFKIMVVFFMVVVSRNKDVQKMDIHFRYFETTIFGEGFEEHKADILT